MCRSCRFIFLTSLFGDDMAMVLKIFTIVVCFPLIVICFLGDVLGFIENTCHWVSVGAY